MQGLKAHFYIMISYFKVSLAYRVEILLWGIKYSLRIVLIIVIWGAVYSESGGDIINGYSYGELVFYYLAQFVVLRFVYTDAIWYVADDVKSGRIATFLIKPVSYRKMLFSMTMGGNIGFILLVGPLYLISLFYVNYYFDLGITYSVIDILSIVISLSASILINFYIINIFTSLVFFTTNAFGVSQFHNAINKILSGVLVPIVFLPTILRNIFAFLPFQYTIYVPAAIILKKYNGNELIKVIGIQFLWIFILYIVSTFIWNRSLKKANILGG